MSTVTPTTGWEWSPGVLAFAAENHVEDCLEPLRQAVQGVFPTATSVRVFMEDDPEIRDLRFFVVEVQVPDADIPNYSAASGACHQAMDRVCPRLVRDILCLSLRRVDS